jgi:(E)-4-hydroxy-3-methyl-but-2-enyl pyrophosphate reductase
MLEIFIAEYAGFCEGVKRSVGLAEEALRISLGTLYTFGPIVHNAEVTAALARRGAKEISSNTQVSRGATVVLRAHGVVQNEIQGLRMRGAVVVDGTCSNVKAIHQKIAQFVEKGVLVYIAGDPSHAETSAHVSRGGSNIVVVSSHEQAMDIDVFVGAPSALLAQTSFDRAEFHRIESVLKKRILKLETVDTMCRWMQLAQDTACSLAHWMDIMVVVGDRRSANTARLESAVRGTGKPLHLARTASDLKFTDYFGASRIGITAGASTPPESIDGVVRWFVEKFGAALKE